ncbi:MAG: NAD(P)-binding domain-containing protein [Coxiellaceae bacterium]|nr:NAD(P)-binding domain-containing protein [Coxiellaceae bacterium]
MKIAIIGCGEVGYLYAVALIDAGYSVQLCAPRPSETVIKLVAEKNIVLHKEINVWLKEIDIVISCVPGSASLSAAKEAILFLNPGSIFSDFSSSSSNDKREAASIAALKNINYLDVVIMGGVDLTGSKTPLLCAGTGSEKIITIMHKLSAPIRVLENAKAGDAASLKLLRTVFMKGLSALTVECMVAAESQGVKALLYEILSDFDKTPLNEYLDMLLRNHVMHACRQQHEIADSAEELKSAGLPVQLLPSIEALFEKTCKDSQSSPISNKNPTTKEALQWLIKTRCNQK